MEIKNAPAEPAAQPAATAGLEVPPSGLLGFVRSFTDLLHLPRGFWFVIGAYVIESMAYFGILTLMTTYLSTDLSWGDKYAGVAVSVFTMLVTLFMLGVGSYAERFGLRRAILFALFISTLGRVLYCLAPSLHGGGMVVATVLGSMVVVAIGSAILSPVCYSGVKQYTTEKTNSMGYGMIYALMNLGIVGVGAISAWLRPAVQRFIDGKSEQSFDLPILAFFSKFSATGVQAVNWACVGITAATFLLFWVFMTRKVEAGRLRPDDHQKPAPGSERPLVERLREYFAGGPFSNPRFIFFIFMLLPVRTLFAHQWLTMPQYILRTYPQSVADRMEWLVNWINPMIIFVAVPVVTALTRKVHVYTMMMIGTLVSAAPTFLLCGGPNLPMLLTYFTVFSIGEALWSARFYEYASELAPAGRIAQYMGLANIPWLLAKGTTGFYSGWLLASYVPKDAPPESMHSGTLWFIYGCIAMLSPVGLWMARKWVMAGLKH